MKFLKSGAFIALLIVSYFQSAAQNSAPPVNEPDYNKPKLFSDLPDNLSLRLPVTEALLNVAEGAQVNVTIATGFNLIGTVVSKSNAADASVKSIVIKSLTRQGAAFTITRIKNADGSFVYTGRMISHGASDALVIAREGDSYIIRKKVYYDLINE